MTACSANVLMSLLSRLANIISWPKLFTKLPLINYYESDYLSFCLLFTFFIVIALFTITMIAQAVSLVVYHNVNIEIAAHFDVSTESSMFNFS